MADIVQREVFEMNKFAVDPERGAGVREVRSLNKALPDGRASEPLVEVSQGDAGVGNRTQKAVDGQFREIVTR